MGHGIREVSEHLDSLPMLPGVVTRLLSLDREDNEYFEKLLPLAQQDPAFALRIIRLANSPVFRSYEAIDDLQTAITRVGTYRVAALITSLAVMEIFVPNEKDARNLWLHSIQVAITARNLAQKSPSVDPSEAYLCGLMHDIGRFVLFSVATGDVRSIDESGWETPQQLIDVELQVLGINHADLGWCVCRKWMMPEKVCKVVQAHHSPDLGSVAASDGPLAGLIRLIQVADHFSVLLITTADFGQRTPQGQLDLIQDRVMDTVGKGLTVTAGQLQQMAAGVLSESKEQCQALGLHIR